MRIGIFETEHFEGAYPVIKLFDDDNNDITIFTYQNAYRQFQHLFKNEMNRYHWIVKPEAETKIQFIRRMYYESKKRKLQILYLNTITNNFIFYALMIFWLRKIRVIVTLHDINGYFKFKPALSLRWWVRSFGKQWLIKLVKEFNVVSDTMVNYLQNKLPPHKKVHCVPGAVFEEGLMMNTAPEIINSIYIVVPGTLDKRRRNYNAVFELLEQINVKKLALHFILLGGYNAEYGKEILNRCKQYAAKNNNLQFYETTVVDQPEFDRVMNEAHFVFIPSVIDTVIADGIAETYGLSISSGNIFDIIKHAKPFIIPARLSIPANLESSCFRYTNLDEITAFLSGFTAKPEQYIDWREKAFVNSKQFTIEKIREKNATLFFHQPGS